MIKVVWTGAAGLRIETGKEVILVDPYYSKIARQKLFFGNIVPDPDAISRCLGSLEHITSIIVGHTHFDHALDIPVLAKRCAGPILGSSSLDTLMALNDMAGQVMICKGSETIPLTDDIRITMLMSEHGRILLGKVPFPGEISPQKPMPLRASEYRLGTVFSPRIQVKDTVFLHVGSAGFIEQSLKNQSCDVLFLCVAGWDKTNRYPEQIIEITHPQTIILFHFDDFFKHHRPGRKTKRLMFIKMRQLICRIEKMFPDIRLIVPEIGEALHF